MAGTVERVVSLPSPRSDVDSGSTGEAVGGRETIGGRAGTWPPPGPADDEGYEPTIVRGRD